jgi:hypothetical protein
VDLDGVVNFDGDGNVEVAAHTFTVGASNVNASHAWTVVDQVAVAVAVEVHVQDPTTTKSTSNREPPSAAAVAETDCFGQNC